MKYYFALATLLLVGLDLPAEAATLSSTRISDTDPALESALDVRSPALLLPPAPKSWELECQGKSASHYGKLLLNDVTRIDPTRCVRFVRSNLYQAGDFHLRADDGNTNTGAFHQLGRPYLETIAGDLRIEGKQTLDEVYLPRLRVVEGDVSLDLRNALEYVDMPAMTGLNKLTVYLRPMNSDLSGLDNVTSIDRLVISNTTQTNDIAMNGLNGVTDIGSISISGNGVYDPGQLPTQDIFLTSLVNVGGNVVVEGDNLIELYGLQNLQHVAGNLEISDSSLLQSLGGLGSLQSVTGTLVLDGINGLASISGIGAATVGSLVVTDNPDLVDLSGFLGLGVAAGGNAVFGNNPVLPCAQIDQFEAQHPGTPVVRNINACQ